METKALSDFIADIRFEHLSAKTVDYTKMCIQDLIGVAIAGSDDSTAKIWGEYLLDGSLGKEGASCWRSGFEKGEYHSVAAYNAACSHVLDLDDVHNGSITHPGTITIPGAMAVAEKRHCSGKKLIEAVVGGYEAAARIGAAINPGAYWYWHTTGVVGSFSTAAAVGKLMDLNKEKMLNAFGSAGTQSAGLWEFIENGSMSKTLHTANATLCGMRAAELAALGFTGAATILEGRKGFLGALNPKADKDALTRDLRAGNYQIDRNSFKPYACCRHIHSANYGIALLKEEVDLNPDRIQKIVDHTYQVAKNTADNAHPTTDYAYKFSIQYCLAAMIIYGNLMGDVFSEDKTHDPDVQRLMSKVEVVVDAKLQQEYEKDPTKWAHSLEIYMDDGSVHCKTIEYPLGDFMNPFTWQVEDGKFMDITKDKLAPEQAKLIMQRIKKLEEIEDVNLLFKF